MKDLTQGPIPRHLVAMAVPIALGMLLQTLYYIVDLYFVGFAGDASEDVYRQDVEAAKRVMDEKWGTTDRSLMLVNNPRTLLTTPIATLSNLRDALEEVAGAMDHAVAEFLERDGVRITQYGTYFLDMVSGRLLQLTNSDRSRTYVAVHQHAGRLYIQEATVPADMPEPILFLQSLAWVNDQGQAIRYRTLYTEGYADWKFPQPAAPPHSLRDLDVSREQPPRPPRLFWPR